MVVEVEPNKHQALCNKNTKQEIVCVCTYYQEGLKRARVRCVCCVSTRNHRIELCAVCWVSCVECVTK